MAKYYLGDPAPKCTSKLKIEFESVLEQIDNSEAIEILQTAIKKANQFILNGALNSDEIFKFDKDGNPNQI
jgi:hypothetical protein